MPSVPLQCPMQMLLGNYNHVLRWTNSNFSYLAWARKIVNFMALHFEGWALQHLLSIDLFNVQIKETWVVKINLEPCPLHCPSDCYFEIWNPIFLSLMNQWMCSSQPFRQTIQIVPCIFDYKIIMCPSLVERMKTTKVWNAGKGRKVVA